MRRINTYAELKEERKRLKIRQSQIEFALKQDVEDIKVYFQPMQLAGNAISSFFSVKERSLTTGAINTVMNFVLRKIVLRNSGWLTRMIVPVLARKSANSLFDANRTKIKKAVADWVMKALSPKKHVRNYEQSTADSTLYE
jgi:hypothetical protein